MLGDKFVLALQTLTPATAFINNITPLLNDNVLTQIKTLTKSYTDQTVYLYLISGTYQASFADKLEDFLKADESTYFIALQDGTTAILYQYGTLSNYCNITVTSTTVYSFAYDVGAVDTTIAEGLPDDPEEETSTTGTDDEIDPIDLVVEDTYSIENEEEEGVETIVLPSDPSSDEEEEENNQP